MRTSGAKAVQCPGRHAGESTVPKSTVPEFTVPGVFVSGPEMRTEVVRRGRSHGAAERGRLEGESRRSRSFHSNAGGDGPAPLEFSGAPLRLGKPSGD